MANNQIAVAGGSNASRVVEISDLNNGTKYIAISTLSCRDETDRSVYEEVVRLNDVITMGKVVGRPLSGDEAILMAADEAVRPRIQMELQIVRKTIRTFRDAGFNLVADNGEYESAGSERQLIDCLFACDEARLIVSNGTVSGWIFFVMGNDGWDVINDYTTNLEPWFGPIDEYAAKLEDEASR